MEGGRHGDTEAVKDVGMEFGITHSSARTRRVQHQSCTHRLPSGGCSRCRAGGLLGAAGAGREEDSGGGGGQRRAQRHVGKEEGQEGVEGGGTGLGGKGRGGSEGTMTE